MVGFSDVFTLILWVACAKKLWLLHWYKTLHGQTPSYLKELIAPYYPIRTLPVFSYCMCEHCTSPLRILATDSNTNAGSAYTCRCPLNSNSVIDPTCVLQSLQATVHMLWEKCRDRGYRSKIFPAPFPECSGTKVSYRVSVSTFQLPIIEQIALNQIYLHGLFFVIWVQSD